MLSSRIARGLVATLVAISPLLLSSCQNSLTDNLLEAEQPTLIDPSNVDSPAGADAIRLGTLINFRNITNVWTFGGLVGDEFVVHARGDSRGGEIRVPNSNFTNHAREEVLRHCGSGVRADECLDSL